MSSSIPSLPTLPMESRAREVVYAVWAWASVVLTCVTIGWAIVTPPPIQLLAVSSGLNAFGIYAGFMAKNNVR